MNSQHLMETDSLDRSDATALAQPEPEGLTDIEWEDLKERLWDQYQSVGFQGERFMYDSDFDNAFDAARQKLARWSRPTIEPVPVAERPWEREGWCDAEGFHWLWGPLAGCWFYRQGAPIDYGYYTHSLPHHALPVPGAEAQS